jgi:ABC-type spermidine/putrescine transport system permease subunit II
MEVNELMGFDMTANWAGAVVNTLLVAFFVVIAIGIALGVYAARALKKAEQARMKME